MICTLWWPRGSLRFQVYMYIMPSLDPAFCKTGLQIPGLMADRYICAHLYTSRSPDSVITNSGTNSEPRLWTPHSTSTDSGLDEVEIPESGLHNTGLRTSTQILYCVNITLNGCGLVLSRRSGPGARQVKCLSW